MTRARDDGGRGGAGVAGHCPGDASFPYSNGTQDSEDEAVPRARWKVLLDNGGVMNDNKVRAVQWKQLLADIFVQKFGGRHAHWAIANAKIWAHPNLPPALQQEEIILECQNCSFLKSTEAEIDTMQLTSFWRAEDRYPKDLDSFYGNVSNADPEPGFAFRDGEKKYCLFWLQGMLHFFLKYHSSNPDRRREYHFQNCGQKMGQISAANFPAVSPPLHSELPTADELSNADFCVKFVRNVNREVIPKVKAEYPDAIPAILKLHELGYSISTASNEASHELDWCLSGMGVRHCFQEPLCGIDHANVAWKGCLEYYDHVFSANKVSPSQAVVVDDKDSVLEYPRQLGALTILLQRPDDGNSNSITMTGGRKAAEHAHYTITTLLDLPSLLEEHLRASST